MVWWVHLAPYDVASRRSFLVMCDPRARHARHNVKLRAIDRRRPMQCRNVGGRVMGLVSSTNSPSGCIGHAESAHDAVMPPLVAARCTPDLFCAAEHLSTVATTNPRSPRTCDGFLRARKRGCARVANPKREPSDASVACNLGGHPTMPTSMSPRRILTSQPAG